MSEKQSILDNPARKFFVAQLCNCIQLEKDDTEQRNDEWIYHDKNGYSITFSQVWIQGFVVLVSADGNNILIDDGTGIVHVTGVNKLVKNFLIDKGMYVMVAGILRTTGQSASQSQSSSSSYPTIKILKFSDKSENLSTETLWMLEVIDSQQATCIQRS